MEPAQIPTLVQLAARAILIGLMRAQSKISSREVRIPRSIHEDLRDILTATYVGRFATHATSPLGSISGAESYGVRFGRSRCGHKLITRGRRRRHRNCKVWKDDVVIVLKGASVQTLYALDEHRNSLGGIVKRSIECSVYYKCPDCGVSTRAYGGSALSHHDTCFLNVETCGF